MTTMLEKLEKISAKLFQESLKTYHLKDLITHKRASHLSLVEKCALYPNAGVGFHVRRRNWPAKMYIRITESILKVFNQPFSPIDTASSEEFNT